MKKLLLFFGILFFIFTGCSNEELSTNEATGGLNSQSKIRWYGTKLCEGIHTKGVADGNKRWNQEAGIYIKFLNEPTDSQITERVKQIASEWEEYAGIKFHFVDTNIKTDVRIAFDWNGNDWLTWSYTGTDAKFEKNQSQPTGVLAGLESLDDKEFKGDILRLFGQILGLEYEQRHQEWSKNGYWKTESQLQTYWEDQFDGYDMDWSEIREYVFDPLTKNNTLQLMQSKEIDELSVMAWPYYNRKQTSKLLANYELSDGDKAFITQLYPKREELLPTIQEAWVNTGYMEWWTDEKGRLGLQMTKLGQQQKDWTDVRDGEQLRTAYNMFARNTIITRAPVFNSSNIENFLGMFGGCHSLNAIPHLDTSKGTDFSLMFEHCSSITSIPQINTSNGINFTQMFRECKSLTTIPQLDTSKGTEFRWMFANCDLLITIPQLNTSSGTDFSLMFNECTSLTTIPQLDTSKGIIFRSMFRGCTSLTCIPYLNTSSGTDFWEMFNRCHSLTSIPLLDMSNGRDFCSTFAGCKSLTTIPQLDTSKGIYFSFMFEYCSGLTCVPALNTSKGTHLWRMFADCSSLTSKPEIDLSNAQITWGIFAGTLWENDPL